jgi:hypothetical protein
VRPQRPSQTQPDQRQEPPTNLAQDGVDGFRRAVASPLQQDGALLAVHLRIENSAPGFEKSKVEAYRPTSAMSRVDKSPQKLYEMLGLSGGKQ